MDPLSVAASIAGLVTLADAVFRRVYKYYKSASDASNEIKELADRIQSLAGILHSLGILADALEQDGTHSTIQMTHVADATRLLGEIQARLDKFKPNVNSTKLGVIEKSLKWPFTKTRTKDLTEKLTQQHQMIGLALHADSLSNLVKLLNNGKDIKTQLSSIQLGVENLQMLTRVKVDGERRRILDFFLKVNPQPNLDTSIKLRHPNTGSWLIESLQFQQWIETAGSRMWLSGIPGAGKTVLAGAVIQKALEKGKNSPKVGVAFFFCDYKDEKATVLSNILGAMASQLARQNDPAFHELEKLYESLNPPDGLTKDPDSDVLHDCLERIFECFDQIILVVDGLDECGDNTGEVTQALANIADYSANVTTALASRDEYNIDLKLRDSFTKIKAGARKEELLLYVASEIDRRIKDGRLRINDMDLKDEILTRLSDDADGMFRWVACQLDYICGCPTDADRREALNELPPTLDATYDRMLRRLNKGHPRVRHIVQKCFQLISLKWVDISILGLRHAISVPDALDVTLKEHDIVTEAEISLQCSCFIRKSEKGDTFEFSHFTVREFLERETLLNDHELAGYHISKSISSAALVQQCLRYLRLRNFDHTSNPDHDGQIEQVRERKTKFPFYDDAAILWFHALRHAPQDPVCLELAKSLFHPRKNPSFISWAVQLLVDQEVYLSVSQDEVSSEAHLYATTLVSNPNFRTMHLAAALDLPEICEYLLETDSKWNTTSSVGTPLECSIGRAFCLNRTLPSSPLDITKNWHMEQLSYATHRPGLVISMLRTGNCVLQNPPQKFRGMSLMSCASFSATAWLDFSPVSSLVCMGWVVSDEEATSFEQSMKCVIERYPFDYGDGPHTDKARLAASFHDLITSLNKLRIFETGPGYRMCVAAWNTAVELQCEFTNDTSLLDTRITLSLEALISKVKAAISNDDAEAMKRYLEDVRITGPEIDDDGTEACGYALLRQAIISNSFKIASLLADRGYSFGKPFSNDVLPIHEAWDCEEDIIGLLLKSGASHLDRDSDGNNIWHLAAANFEYNTIAALLKLAGDKGIKALQMQNNEGFTPLALAINNSTEQTEDDQQDTTKVVQLLLDACGDDALCWQCASSPWDLAARYGSVVVTRYLADTGVPLDTIQEGRPTPLHVLNEHVSKECVELLMRIFPTANGLRFEGRTPLERFIYRCIEQRTVPQQGVIESLAEEKLPDNQIQKIGCLWKHLCTDIIGSETLEWRNDIKRYDDPLDFIIQTYLQMKTIETYEELTGQSAAILFFSSLVRSKIITTLPAIYLREVISRTKFWKSACSAQETIEYVKSLVERPNNGRLEQLRMLLSNGIDIHLRRNTSSILEEACRILICDEDYGDNSTHISSNCELGRLMFEDIINHARLEQSNAMQLTNGGFLQALANRGSLPGTKWMIERLVGKGLDFNKPRVGPWQDPPLILFLSKSATPVGRSLLELGADPFVSNVCNVNAAHAATMRGDLDFLKSLLHKVRGNLVPFPWQQTTNISAFLRQGHKESFFSVNVLHIASLNGQTECFQFFIDHQLVSDAMSKAAGGYNCLHFAGISGSKETIKYLHSLGLDINQPADDGRLPIHYAIQGGKIAAVETLVELGSATFMGGYRMTPQIYFEYLDNPHVRGYLQRDDLHPQHQCQKGFPKHLLDALESAIREGDIKACERLEVKGPLLEVFMPSCGCSPLITAILSKREKIVSWLLGKRVSVLHAACLKHGGMSTLDLAVRSQLLTPYLQQILDACLETAWDLGSLGSPIYWSLSSGNHANLALIVEHIRKNSEKYSILTGHSQETVLSYMVNERFSLHLAAYLGNLDMVKILLDAGADVDRLDGNKLTAIQVTEDPHITTHLVAAGAKSGWFDSTSWARIVIPFHGHSAPSENLLRLLGEQARRQWTASTRNLPGFIYEVTSKPVVLNPATLSSALQHDIDLNVPDYSQRTLIHMALYSSQSTSYLLSLPQIVDCKPFPWHTTGRLLNHIPWINEHWRLFKRRIPSINFRIIMNLHPEKGISPLCQAAAIDSLDVIDRCLEMGADIDFDGSSYGSALMAACANCRLKAVKYLVRCGASIVYDGQLGRTSAIEMANGHKKIITWLLVGQFTEQTKLEYPIFEDPNNTPLVRHWSGIQQRPMRLTGYDERQPHESLKDYVFRLAEIRLDMQGIALPLHKKDPLASLSDILCYQI
ncbi:hypothetical protein EV127DRAFT_441261 [Xylaria flabelliformis]|nr:hypothetical protein EV127DRAFT_441261 [Xylaria flabelliformis]